MVGRLVLFILALSAFFPKAHAVVMEEITWEFEGGNQVRFIISATQNGIDRVVFDKKGGSSQDLFTGSIQAFPNRVNPSEVFLSNLRAERHDHIQPFELKTTRAGSITSKPRALFFIAKQNLVVIDLTGRTYEIPLSELKLLSPTGELTLGPSAKLFSVPMDRAIQAWVNENYLLARDLHLVHEEALLINTQTPSNFSVAQQAVLFNLGSEAGKGRPSSFCGPQINYTGLVPYKYGDASVPVPKFTKDGLTGVPQLLSWEVLLDKQRLRPVQENEGPLSDDSSEDETKPTFLAPSEGFKPRDEGFTLPNLGGVAEESAEVVPGVTTVEEPQTIRSDATADTSEAHKLLGTAYYKADQELGEIEAFHGVVTTDVLKSLADLATAFRQAEMPEKANHCDRRVHLTAALLQDVLSHTHQEQKALTLAGLLIHEARVRWRLQWPGYVQRATTLVLGADELLNKALSWETLPQELKTFALRRVAYALEFSGLVLDHVKGKPLDKENQTVLSALYDLLISVMGSTQKDLPNNKRAAAILRETFGDVRYARRDTRGATDTLLAAKKLFESLGPKGVPAVVRINDKLDHIKTGREPLACERRLLSL